MVGRAVTPRRGSNPSLGLARGSRNPIRPPGRPPPRVPGPRRGPARHPAAGPVVRQRRRPMGCAAARRVPRAPGVVRAADHVRQAGDRPVGSDPDLLAADARGVHDRHPGRPRHGRLRSAGADRQHRRRDPRDAVRGRPSGAHLEPDPGRLLRAVPRGARLPDRRAHRAARAETSRSPSETPAGA